ncbi:MAG: Mini-ribonuclease 3 [Oscillospiraceae bacterium]|jgi:ribonuclease-3 family protein|uniref:Mini-ribonuclease 3 n=1 Tax=Vescimonas coprocola TaxID=2714355 RepID=A0A810Q376_9FIRM|nr:ribonuclease III domain-containing protein [Vescimonas coprocola]MBS5503300.1 ribonuclease III [Bacillota bacterium]BCK80965.1 mini-ribonuclease 3 [Vescimonas coprocola]
MTDYLHIQLPPDQIRGISSIGLAHMGDAVYELLVRTWLCAHGKATGKGLHRATVALVCAPKQAELAQRILPLLTEEEQAVFRRGRNANVHSIPAHASRAQYQQATALEALLGWLHLSGRHDRVEQLFAVMMEGE